MAGIDVLLSTALNRWYQQGARVSRSMLSIADEGGLFSRLDTMASRGQCSEVELDAFVELNGPFNGHAGYRLACYIASLYLLEGAIAKSDAVLRPYTTAGREMRRYAALLMHRRQHGLRMPRLSAGEHRALDYLQRTLVTGDQLLTVCLREASSYAVFGNAPGPRLPVPDADCCAFMFNDFRQNSRLAGPPLVHVVTPSSTADLSYSARFLMITGNSIFHRRSRVWQRFSSPCGYERIAVFPRQLWAQLYNRLEAPASAGALLLSCLATRADLQAKRGLIAGFSVDDSAPNHSYDNTPKSSRHNWPAESALLADCFRQLDEASGSLQVVR